jgi:heme/copper-type cytochrome/quinol oxidase subunit 4
MRIDAYILKSLHIKIGDRILDWNVLVTSITDAFIIGMDFSHKHKAKLDLGQGTVQIEDQLLYFDHLKTKYSKNLLQ